MAETIAFDKPKLTWTLPWDDDWVTAVRFIGPRRLAAGNNRGAILLWDLPEKPGAAAPLPVRRLEGHTNSISRLLLTPDGRRLISASYDHTIRYWDTQAAATGSGTVALNARTREDLIRRKSSKVPEPVEAKVELQNAAQVLDGHKDWIQGITLSNDGTLLVSGDDAGEVILWDATAGKEQRRFKLKGWAYGLAVSPDKKQALIGERRPLVFDSGRRVAVQLWDLTKAEPQRDLSADFKDMQIAAAAYAPDGKLLAIGRGGETERGTVFLLDPATGKKVRELTPVHQYGITDLVFHPDGKHLLSSGRDTMVRIWNTADGKMVAELSKSRGGQFKDWIHAIACSADGRTIAAADMAGAVQVWTLGA